MSKYIIQIQVADNGLKIGWLAKSFEVSDESPIPKTWPANRAQIEMTNTSNFNEIMAAYDEYATELSFSHDEETGTISCTGAINKTWSID